MVWCLLESLLSLDERLHAFFVQILHAFAFVAIVVDLESGRVLLDIFDQLVLLEVGVAEAHIAFAELAGLVEVEPITVARLIDRLEGRGFVERRADPKDRRINRLHLSEAAVPLLDEIHAHRRALTQELTAGIDPAAIDLTRATVKRMKANLLDERTCNAKAV